MGVDRNMRLTMIIHRENDGYVAQCLELDIASQGDSIEQARDNLAEAVELFFESASPAEIEGRPRTEIDPGFAVLRAQQVRHRRNVAADAEGHGVK